MMEETLLPPTGRSSETDYVVVKSESSHSFLEELKNVSCVAAPMVAVTVSQYLPQMVSLMMVGHLGELELSGVALGISFSNVTGFSVLMGLAGALETLCGQTYGAEQFHKLGNYTLCAIISLMSICIPISVLWVFMDKILVLFGQDPAISLVAGKYCICLIVALFGFAVLQAFVRYFQTQSLILPMVLTSTAVLLLHIPICWCFVFKMELGQDGAAFAIGISYWLNVILLGLYMKYSQACAKSQIVLRMNALSSVKEFFYLAIPSALMFCLEWWSFELVVILGGLLPNPELETSVLSICLNMSTLHFNIPFGIGAAASTRVSNDLGAGRPEAARNAVRAVMVVGVSEAIVVSTAIFCCRYILGYAFSDEKEVVNYIADLVPFLCLSVSVDGLLIILCGIARGSGWQKIGAYINLGAYYGIGIPVAVLLGFVLHLRGKGLWIGLLIGATVQAVILGLITAFTNWGKQAAQARERIFEGENQAHKVLA